MPWPSDWELEQRRARRRRQRLEDFVYLAGIILRAAVNLVLLGVMLTIPLAVALLVLRGVGFNI